MTPPEKAFLEADFNWVSTSAKHMEGSAVTARWRARYRADRIMREFAALRRSETPKVIGQVISGPARIGQDASHWDIA